MEGFRPAIAEIRRNNLNGNLPDSAGVFKIQ
jgi:hypothetical protein